MTGTKQAFLSYAHADEDYVKRLRIHLKPLEKKYNFIVWDDKKLKPGDKWKDEILQNIEHSSVVILLISADFLASQFVMDFEYPKALAQAKDKGTKIVALIASPCLFEEFEIYDFQAINSPNETLQDLENNAAAQERVFVECAKTVSRYLNA